MTFSAKRYLSAQQIIEIYSNICNELGRPATATDLRRKRKEDPQTPTLEDFLHHFDGKLRELQAAAKQPKSKRGGNVEYRHDDLLAFYARLWIWLYFTRTHNRSRPPGSREIEATKQDSNRTFPSYKAFCLAFDWQDEFVSKARMLILHWQHSKQLVLPEEFIVSLQGEKKGVNKRKAKRNALRELCLNKLSDWIFRNQKLPEAIEIIEEAERNDTFPGLSELHRHFNTLDDALSATREFVADKPSYKQVQKVFEASYPKR